MKQVLSFALLFLLSISFNGFAQKKTNALSATTSGATNVAYVLNVGQPVANIKFLANEMYSWELVSGQENGTIAQGSNITDKIKTALNSYTPEFTNIQNVSGKITFSVSFKTDVNVTDLEAALKPLEIRVFKARTTK